MLLLLRLRGEFHVAAITGKLGWIVAVVPPDDMLSEVCHGGERNQSAALVVTNVEAELVLCAKGATKPNILIARALS